MVLFRSIEDFPLSLKSGNFHHDDPWIFQHPFSYSLKGYPGQWMRKVRREISKRQGDVRVFQDIRIRNSQIVLVDNKVPVKGDIQINRAWGKLISLSNPALYALLLECSRNRVAPTVRGAKR